MKFIATNVDDSYRLLGERISAQQERSGFALDSYFYRSHLTYQRELERILYTSWLYAGHISPISYTPVTMPTPPFVYTLVVF